MHDQAHWCRVFEGTEACVSPVLSLAELPEHPHFQARANFGERDGVLHVRPAPRFSEASWM
ncbi:CoA transferase [Comamonas thiooxydans]|nr:hypothetical protein [Comamonas thiooxydans]MDH1255719.1 CoA transferase [Comamonas thiooxydans]